MKCNKTKGGRKEKKRIKGVSTEIPCSSYQTEMNNNN